MKLLLLLLPCALYASVDGSPLAPLPGPQPDMWMSVGNDNFLPYQPDDNLTAQWNGGFTIDKVAVGFSYDMLTEKYKNGYYGTGIREDELTFDIGPCAFVKNISNNKLACQVAFGAILDGNLEGRYVQENFHRDINEKKPLSASYDNNRIKPRGVILTDIRDDYSICNNLFIEASFQGESDLNWNKEVFSLFPTVTFSRTLVFCGPTYQKSYHQLSETSGIVDKTYDGIGVIAGIKVSSFYFTASHNHNKIGNGCFGVEYNF